VKNLFLCFLGVLTFSLQAAEVQSVHFHQEGEISMLTIELDKEAYAEKAHLKDDKQIILDLKGVKASAKHLRGIDTSEFSGSAVYVSVYPKPGAPNDLRFAIQLRDNVRSILESRNNKITLSLENRFGVFTKRKIQKADEQEKLVARTSEDEKINIPRSTDIIDILDNLTKSGVKKYVGKQITINVNNMPVVELLKMIADTSGFNIIIEKGVETMPSLTLNLINIPWDQALDTIMSISKLAAKKHGNILTITTAEQARLERENELKNRVVSTAQEPLVTKIFPISYATLDELKKVLEDYATKERGSIQVDKRTNKLIVKDTVDVIERMKEIIEFLDAQTPQILIESKIVEVTELYEFRLGLGGTGVRFGYDPLTPGISDRSASGASFSFNSATNGGTPSFMSGTINVFKRLNNLDFSLDLMEAETKGKIVSSPKVLAKNNEPAMISTDTTRSFAINTVQPGGAMMSGFQEVNVSLNLTVTPQVTNEGAISMNIALQKGSFGARDFPGAAPNRTTNNITTNVLVDNGSTIVIGGIYSTESEEAISGVPFFKDLPLIGWLFRSAYNPKSSKSELVVFMTPRIVNQEEAGLVDRKIGSSGL